MWPEQLKHSDRYYPFLAQKDASIKVNKLFMYNTTDMLLVNSSYLRIASKQNRSHQSGLLEVAEQKGNGVLQ